MDNNEEEFLSCARYGLMLAEQLGDDFIRANLLKLVRAWLAAAKETVPLPSFRDDFQDSSLHG
jgi:hypothetical protein